ncbi:PadR family transcriptional regulator [Actinomadura logoneensis]|uniref:PadR family transcriptional regulator n=1 Tax=Actinomadura logoneensis TaxID=2293572 RepID=A0A372JJ02_9ACTN|nr:PadR family transcriptional regulator [Actinomadura logoneensis]RFU39899.1 PadR family transcriptional regulator [Actinomadura logoneensis]
MSLRHAALGLLVEMDGASGYDLLKMFEITMGNVWQATQSQLYGELNKLTAEGFIEVASEGPRGRKEYRVTDAGRAELRRWLLEVPPKIVRRDDVLLRMFFLGQVEPEEAAAFVRKQSAGAERALADLTALEGRIEWGDDNLSFYGRLAMEYGRRFLAMRADWYEWVVQELAERDAPKS